jgi:hypothetical protein
MVRTSPFIDLLTWRGMRLLAVVFLTVDREILKPPKKLMMDEIGFGNARTGRKSMWKMREAKPKNREYWKTNLSKKVVHNECLN